MPLVSKAFGDIITFTRASTATYFDSAGVLQSAAIDTPRFDYNPATLAARGFLIEEARTNLLTYSEEFDNAQWTKTRSTVTANAIAAPDGNTTADKLVEDSTAANSHYVAQNVVHTGAQTLSLFAKKAEIEGLILWGIGATSYAAGFNLTTGTSYTEAISGVIPPDISTNIVNVGNGWFRCSISFTASSGTSIRLLLDKNLNGTGISDGDGTSGIYIWGAQLEAGASTINSGTASGTTTAVVLSAGSATDDIYNGNVLFVNGEYRVITDYVGATKTATVAALTATPSGAYVVTGGNAPFPTSYIPTTTTALTRSADVARVNTLSPWFNSAEGSIYFEASSSTINSYQFSLFGSSTQNRIFANYLSFDRMQAGTRESGNFSSATTSAGTAPLNTVGKGALSYKVNDGAFSWNGAAAIALSPLPTALPTILRLDIGNNGSLAGNWLNGYLRRITYYPRRLSNAELQSITS